MNQSSGSGSTGLDPKLASMLAYLLGPVGGIVFYAISKDSYVKFHAMQSILLSVVAIIIYSIFWWTIFGYFGYITWLIDLAITAVFIIMMVKAYSGERYKLPVIGDMAEKYSK